MEKENVTGLDAAISSNATYNTTTTNASVTRANSNPSHVMIINTLFMKHLSYLGSYVQPELVGRTIIKKKKH